jgi:hypothetical protein
MLEKALRTNAHEIPPIDLKERVLEIETVLKKRLLPIERQELKRERVFLLKVLYQRWKKNQQYLTIEKH